MIIRAYQPEDLLALHRIDAICFPKGIAYTRAELHYYTTDPRCLTLVATEDTEDEEGQVVGFIIAQLKRTPKQALQQQQGRLWGHIITIDVIPSFRRRGVGQALLSEAEQWLIHQGCSLVQLEVSTENIPAIAFYKKNGYCPSKRLNGYYIDGTDAYLMKKELSDQASPA